MAGPARESLLIGAEWPVLPDAFIDASAEAEIGWLVDLVTDVRALRGEMNVPPSAKPPLAFVAPDAVTAERIARHRDLILTLGRVSEVGSADAAPTGAVTFVSGGSTIALSLAGIIDLTAERARLEKEIAAFDSDIGHVNKKLGNPNFVARAAPEVVDEQRAKLAEAEAGKVKAIASATAARMPELPNTPTFTEAGLPYVYDSWFGLMAPAGVPKPILEKVSKDWADALKTEDVQAKLKAQFLVSKSDTPEQMDKIVKDETASLTELFKETGLATQR